ncbi:phosphohydrolase [Lactonifactor longoviformis]|nr:phosphohydrolase [Lactonifactor longoviformis]MCQ4673110.1 phosphohydrolase [Lactonifactor longoviformis]
MTRRGTMYHRKRNRSNAHTVTDEGNEEFYECIKDIVHHPAVLKMKDYPHHCETSCYQHCLNVAYYNFRICRFFHLDYRAAARAGMLHDLFLYDWREHTEKTGDHFHAMTHPKAALRNAAKYFLITPLEKEIILKHMWPVTLTPPTHWETFIITLTDKYCGSCEIGRYYSHTKIPKKTFLFFKRILKKVFGPNYTYQNYRLPYGSEADAASGVVFTQLRRRPSSSGWRTSRKGRGRSQKYS